MKSKTEKKSNSKDEKSQKDIITEFEVQIDTLKFRVGQLEGQIEELSNFVYNRNSEENE